MEEEGLISTNEATERYATAPASVAGTAPKASVPVMKASAASSPAASEPATPAASAPTVAVVPNENGAVPTNEEQEEGQAEGTLAGAPQFARTYKDVIEDAKSTKTFTALEQAQRQALAAKTEKQVQYSRVLADTARQMIEDGVSPEDVDFSEKQAYRVLSLYAYATDNQGILFDDETRRTFLGEADAVKAAKAIMVQEMRKQAGTLSARTAIESGTEEERVEALNKFYHGDDEYAYEPQFSLEAAKNALLLMDDRAKVFGLEAALSGLGGRDVAVAAALALPSVPAETKTALLKSLGDADKMRGAANMAVAIRDVAKMNDRGLSGVAADFSLQGLTDIANDWVFVGKALMSLASEYSVYTAAEQYAYDHMPQGYEGTAKEFLESLPDSELSKIEGFTTRDDFFAAYDTGETRANDLLAWLDAQELSSPNYSGGVPDYLGTTLEMISRMSPEILGGIIGGMVSGALGSGTGPGALVTATAGAAVGSIATAAAKRALALNFRKAARTLLRKRARAAAKRAYERKAATQLLPAKLAKWSMPGALTLDMGMSQARELNAQSIREGWNMSEQERLLSTLLVAWSGGLVEKAQWALGIGHLRKWAGAAISGKTLAQRLASVSDRSLMNKAAAGFGAWLLGTALEVGAEGLEEGIQEAELQATRLGLSLAGTRTRTGEDVFDANDALKSIITNAGLGLYYAPGLVLPFSGVAGLRRATSGLITRDRTSGEYVRSSFLTADQDLINAQAESEAIWQAAQQKMDEVLVVRAMAIDDEGARTAFYDEQGWNDSQRAAVERAVLYRNIRREYLEGQQKAQERQQQAKKRPTTVSSSNINNANNVLGKKDEEKKDEEKKDEEKKPDPDKMPLVKKGKGATHWAHVLAAWLMFPDKNRRPIDEVRWQIQNTDEAQPLSDEETRVRTREAIVAMLCGSEHAYETLATSKSNIALLDAVRAVAEDLLAIEGGKDAARLSIFRELTAALACRVAEKEGVAIPDYNTSPGVESFWGALDLAVPQTTKELPKFDPSVVDEIRDGLVKAREAADPSSKEAVDSEAYILRHIFGRYIAAIRERADNTAPFDAAATFRASVEWTLTHVKNVRLARNSTAEVLARIIEAANNGDKAAQALVARSLLTGQIAGVARIPATQAPGVVRNNKGAKARYSQYALVIKEDGREKRIPLTSDGVKSLVLYNLQGNKASLIARHSGLFYALGQRAVRLGGKFLDLFGGSGLVTRFLGEVGQLPQGSVLNEFVPARATLLSKSASEPEAVAAAATDIATRCLADANVKAFFEGRGGDDRTVLNWLNDELNGKHSESPKGTYVEEDGSKLKDNAQVAALMLIAQRSTSVSLNIKEAKPASDASKAKSGKAAPYVTEGWALFDDNDRAPRLHMRGSTSALKTALRELSDAKSAKNILTTYARVLTQAHVMQGDGFERAKGEGVAIRPGDTIYIDPPYINTTGYGTETESAGLASPEVFEKKVSDVIDTLRGLGLLNCVTVAISNSYEVNPRSRQSNEARAQAIERARATAYDVYKRIARKATFEFKKDIGGKEVAFQIPLFSVGIGYRPEGSNALSDATSKERAASERATHPGAELYSTGTPRFDNEAFLVSDGGAYLMNPSAEDVADVVGQAAQADVVLSTADAVQVLEEARNAQFEASIDETAASRGLTDDEKKAVRDVMVADRDAYVADRKSRALVDRATRASVKTTKNLFERFCDTIRGWIGGVDVQVLSDEEFDAAVDQVENGGAGRFAVYNAFHGGSARFEPKPGLPYGEFDASFAGTGEGNASFGPGIYLSLQPWVASGYANVSLRRHTGTTVTKVRVSTLKNVFSETIGDDSMLPENDASKFKSALEEACRACLRKLGLQGEARDYTFANLERITTEEGVAGVAVVKAFNSMSWISPWNTLEDLIRASENDNGDFSFKELDKVLDRLQRHSFTGEWFIPDPFQSRTFEDDIARAAKDVVAVWDIHSYNYDYDTYAEAVAHRALRAIAPVLRDFNNSRAVWLAHTRAAEALAPRLASEVLPVVKEKLKKYEDDQSERTPWLYSVSVDFGDNNKNLLWYDSPIPADKKARILAAVKEYAEDPALREFREFRALINILKHGVVYFDEDHDERCRAAKLRDLFSAANSAGFVTHILKSAGFVGHVYPIGSLHGYKRGVDLEKGEGNFVIYDGKNIKINGRQNLFRELRHPATGRVLGLYNMLEHKVYIREGADLSVLAHEVGWHATYNYARQHNRALYEKLRGIVRTALDSNPRLGEEVRKTYGRPVFVEGAGEYQYVMDEEEFIDEVGAALFEQESLQKLQGWVDSIENPSTRKKIVELIKRVWETICKIWCEAIGTYDKYWTKDGKKKVDLDKIVSEVSPLKALDELVDSFVKGEVLSELKELGGTNEARFDQIQGKRKASPYVGRRLEDLIRATLGSKKAVTKDWPEEDVERFVREVGVLMNATDAGPKFLRALTMWQKIGTLDIVEDLYKCVEVARLLTNHPEIAPEAYLSPQELLNAYSDFRAHGFVSPDDYPALTNRREIGADVVVYDVDDSPEGQRQVREIMDSHLGRGSNHSPWCLLRADSKGLAPEATRWWRHYDGTKKRVAFYKGKICAFSASASSKVLWWDLRDNSSEDGNIPVNLSRGKVRYVNEYTGHSFLGNEQKSSGDGVRISVGNISVSRREDYHEYGDDVSQRVTREYGRGTDHLLRVCTTHKRHGNKPMRIMFRDVAMGDIEPEEGKLFQYGENASVDWRGRRTYNVGAQQVEREPNEEHQDFDGYAYVKGPGTECLSHASFSLRTREGAFVSPQSDFKVRANMISGKHTIEIIDKGFAAHNSKKGAHFLVFASGFSLNNHVLVPSATVRRFLGNGEHTDAQLADVALWWTKASEADRQGELASVVQDMFAKTFAAHNAWEKPFVLIQLKRALPAQQSVGLLEEIYTTFETVVNAKVDALLAPHANVRFSKEGEGGVSSEAAETLAYMKEVFGRMKEDIGQEARTTESAGPVRAQEARQEQDTTFTRYADIVQENAQVVLAAMLQNGKLLDSGDTSNGDRREMYVRALVPGASSLMVNDIVETASAAMDEVLAAEAKRGRQIIDRRGTTEQIYARIRDAEQAEAEYVAHSAVLSSLQALMASRDDMQARSDIDKELAARDAQEEAGRGVAERPALSDGELVALGGDTFTPNREDQAADAFTMSVKAIVDKLEQAPPVALGTLRSTLYEHLRAKAGAIPDNRVAGRALSLLDSLMQDANTEKSVVAAAKKVERLIRDVSPKDTIKSLKDKISRMLRPYRTVNPRTPEKDRPNLGLEAIFFSAFRKAIKTNVKVADVEKRINDLGSLIAPSARAVGAKNSVGGLAEFSGDPDMLRLVQEREALVLAREYKLAAAKKTGDINRLYRVYQILGIRMQQGKNAFSNKMAEQERQASDFADTLSDAIYVEGRDKGSEYQGGTRKTLGALFTGTLSLKQQLLDATRFCKDKVVKGRANKAIAALNKKIADADMAVAARKQRDVAWFNREVCALWSTRKGILEKSDNAIAWEATSILTRLATPREEYAAFSASGKTALSYAQLLQIYSSIIQEDVTRPFDEMEKLTGDARNEAFNALSPDARALYWRIQQRAEIEDVIGEEGMQFVADCSAKFVEDAHEVDEVAMDVAGVPMTMRTSNYFPIVRKGVRLRLNEPGDVLSYVPAFMTPRVTSMLDIDETADAFSVWLRRTTDAAHFVAFGRLHMFLGRVFGNTRFAETYTATQGRAMTDQLVQHVRDILTPNLETSSARGYEAFASKLSSLAAHIAIGCNPLVMFRQMTSITAFAFDISWGRMFSAFIKAPASGEDVVERMSDIMNSEGWRARYKNDSEAIQLKMLSQRGKGVVLRGRGAVWWSRLMSAYMFSNKAGDMVPTLFVGQAIYGATKASLLSKINPETGNVYTDEEAKKAALSVTWDSIEKSQQTTRVANMAEWQRSRSALARLFGQFQSAPAQFLAAETAQLRAFVANPREEFWRTMGMLVNNHLVLPGLYTLAGCVYDAVVGPGDEDDDDGKWFWERDQLLTDFVVSSVLGPAAGIYLLGSVLSSIASMVQSQSRREATVPAFSIVSRAAYATQTLTKHAATGEGSTLEDARRLTEALVPMSRTVGDLYDKFTQDEQ